MDSCRRASECVSECEDAHVLKGAGVGAAGTSVVVVTWYAASAGAGVMGRWPACSYVELMGFFINLAEVGYACSS